ncbi:uncharacterized protein LOC120357397 [Solenopsis invicta]|uniref:uncharacterized protein LOC120357397 n=1 Tax=Solenopsis invicta TaxID=13686 RepID=UPI00193CCA1C|nr:uncharacterized protein LOC120357397 [Solenopsis invicta]
MDQQVQKETDLGDKSNSNNFIAEAAEVEIENLPICEKNDCEVNAINNTVNKIDIGKINSIQMSGVQIEDAVFHGPKLNPQQFPRDINGNHFPTKIFEASLANGEKRSVLATCSGYSNEKLWKKLYEKIPNHENSHSHKACYVDWRQFELRIHKHMSVDLQLVESIKNEAKTWIAILQRILDVVLYLGERGLAFRGSNELIGDPKNGNFLGSLQLISHYDTIMHDHLEKARDSTLDVEVNNIKSLLKDLQALRNQWTSILAECKLVAANTGISVTFEEKRRKMRKRQFDESIDKESDSDLETHFKQFFM